MRNLTPQQKQQALCGQRQRLPYFADRTDIGGAERSHYIADHQEQRTKMPNFRASRTSIDRAEGSNQNLHYQYSDTLIFQTEQKARIPHVLAKWDSAEAAKGSEQQALYEQRGRLPFFADRTDIGGADLSHHSTDQQERGPRIPHFCSSRKVSIAQKAQTRTAIHPCSAVSAPQKQNAHNSSACTEQSRHRGCKVKVK